MTAERLAVIATAVSLLGALYTWVKFIRPRVRRFWRLVIAALETLAGRGEIPDEATGRVLPAILPLHRRLAGIEEAQAAQAVTLQTLVKIQADQTALQRTATDHEIRIQSLEDIEVEKTLTREEALEMWRAMNNRDVIDVEADE